MKHLIVIFMLIALNLSASAKIITGGVEISVQEAQSQVIETIPTSFDFNVIRNNFVDSNRVENLTKLLQGYTEEKDRTLGYFSDGSYAVNYKNNPKQVFYYNNHGILTHTEIRTGLNYPYKTYKYSTNGELVNMGLRISEDETFIFDKNGNMLAHWLSNNCFDENQNIIMTRTIKQ